MTISFKKKTKIFLIDYCLAAPKHRSTKPRLSETGAITGK